MEEGPQNSGRLQRSLCAYLPVNGPRWAPRGCSEQAKSCDDSLQTLETDFCMNYLIETKEIFFPAPTSATKQNCPIGWVNDSINHWKSPPTEKNHARMKKQQSHRRHTVFEQTFWDTLIFYFILFFGSRIWKKGLRHESKYRGASTAAASYDDSLGDLNVEDCL